MADLAPLGPGATVEERLRMAVRQTTALLEQHTGPAARNSPMSMMVGKDFDGLMAPPSVAPGSASSLPPVPGGTRLRPILPGMPSIEEMRVKFAEAKIMPSDVAAPASLVLSPPSLPDVRQIQQQQQQQQQQSSVSVSPAIVAPAVSVPPSSLPAPASQSSHKFGVLDSIAITLQKMVELNRAASEAANDDPRMHTPFHGDRPPKISLPEYLHRFKHHMGCREESYIVALIYLDRVIRAYGTFPVISMRSVHRYYLACLLVASKFYQDIFYDNLHYARVGGVTPAELRKLEVLLLHTLDYRLLVNATEFETYRDALLASVRTD